MYQYAFTASKLPGKSSVPHLEYVLGKLSSKMERATTLEFFFLSWAKLLWMELCGECQDLRRTGRRDRETELDDSNLRTFPRHRPKFNSQATLQIHVLDYGYCSRPRFRNRRYCLLRTPYPDLICDNPRLTFDFDRVALAW